MTRTDQQILFTALGFLAVIIRDVPQDKQALRATAIAKLIEKFCDESVKTEAAQSPADKSEVMKNLFANLINDNRKDNRVLDALEALESCLAGDALASEAAFNASVDAASQKFLT